MRVRRGLPPAMDGDGLLPFLTEVYTKMVTKFSCPEMVQRVGARAFALPRSAPAFPGANEERWRPSYRHFALKVALAQDEWLALGMARRILGHRHTNRAQRPGLVRAGRTVHALA